MTGLERALLIAVIVQLVLFLVIVYGINERITKLRYELKQRSVL